VMMTKLLCLLVTCVSSYKVLLFWAVDSDPNTQEMVKKNVEHARRIGGRHCCDVILAHYKGKPGEWDREWMDREVTKSFVQTGFKFRLLQKAYTEAVHQWEDTYEFVWALDSDVDFSFVDLTRLFSVARASGSLIVGPTFAGDQNWLTWTMDSQVGSDGSSKMIRGGQKSSSSGNALMTDMSQEEYEARQKIHILGRPDPSCSYRHTNFVEMTAPLLHAKVLNLLFEECDECIGEQAEWGLDRIWCQLTSKLTNTPQACALIDSTPVRHLDWKKAVVTDAFKATDDKVKARFPNFWSSPEAFDCQRVDLAPFAGPAEASLQRPAHTGSFHAVQAPNSKVR